MRIEDQKDPDMTDLRRQLAYTLLPLDAYQLQATRHVPDSFLIDLYGPQLTLDNVVGRLRNIRAALRLQLGSGPKNSYQLEEQIRFYTRGLLHNNITADERHYEHFFQEQFPISPTLCYHLGVVSAVMFSWGFDHALSAVKWTDIARFSNAWWAIFECADMQSYALSGAASQSTAS